MEFINIIKADQNLKPYFLKYMKYHSLIVAIEHLFENHRIKKYNNLLPGLEKNRSIKHKLLRKKLEVNYGDYINSLGSKKAVDLIILAVMMEYYEDVPREEYLNIED